MADLTRTIIVNGYNLAESTAATVTFNGNQVFSGALTKAVTDNSPINLGKLLEWTFTQSDVDYVYSIDTIVEHSLAITITSGAAGICGINSDQQTVSQWATNSPGKWAVRNNAEYWDVSPYTQLDGESGYWMRSGGNPPFGDGATTAIAERKNILINGAAPSYPANPPYPTGADADSPTWQGWNFEITAGETLTCTLRVPNLTASTIA